jgi:hypothetical protein
MTIFRSWKAEACPVAQFNVAIIYTLPKELRPVRAHFDRTYDNKALDPKDDNYSAFGQIGTHRVVATSLPSGVYGTVSAAAAAAHVGRIFSDIEFCLLVGIGGSIPSTNYDLRLGDVVLAIPTGKYPGVIQYDFVKALENNQFEASGSSRPPLWSLPGAVSRSKITSA